MHWQFGRLSKTKTKTKKSFPFLFLHDKVAHKGWNHLSQVDVRSDD